MDLLRSLLATGVIMDEPLVLSSGQAQTSVATHASTDIMDAGAANPYFGKSGRPWLSVVVQTAIVGSTSASTLQLKLQDAADGSTWNTLYMTSAWADGSQIRFAAGEVQWNMQLPAKLRRYSRVAYVIGGAVLSAGAWDAYITLTPARE